MKWTGLYLFGAGVSFGRSLNCLSEVPKVVLAPPAYSLRFSTLTELGSLYAPGPGPSTFLGFKWSLLPTLELNLEPNEYTGALLGSLALYWPGPRPSSYLLIWALACLRASGSTIYFWSLIFLPAVVYSGTLVSPGPGQFSFLLTSFLVLVPNLNANFDE